MRHVRRLIGGIAGISITALSASAQKAATGWTDYLGGPNSSHFSPLKQITPANVSKLDVAWSFPAGDGNYTLSPLVVDNIAYVAADGGSLVALDATNGKPLWTHALDRGGVKASIGGQRGLNYWESKDRSERRIFVTTSGFLYSIDALTGKEVDSFADHGRLDLKTGIDRTPVSLGSRTPGRTFGNLIILGSFPGEGYLAPPGDIRAFDLHTGQLVWTFHTIPRPGERRILWQWRRRRQRHGLRGDAQLAIDPEDGAGRGIDFGEQRRPDSESSQSRLRVLREVPREG